MVKSILLVGVGGQGTILISKILSAGFVKMGFDVKMSEIHGMSQRGGSVTTQIRYGEKVYSPSIGLGEADVIVSFETVEALRALPYLKQGGRLITDTYEIYSMPVLTGAAEYPSDAIDAIRETGANVTVIEAMAEAQKLGNSRVQNIVLLGALTKVLGLEGIDWEEVVASLVPPKTIELNRQAYRVGNSK